MAVFSGSIIKQMAKAMNTGMPYLALSKCITMCLLIRVWRHFRHTSTQPRKVMGHPIWAIPTSNFEPQMIRTYYYMVFFFFFLATILSYLLWSMPLGDHSGGVKYHI